MLLSSVNATTSNISIQNDIKQQQQSDEPDKLYKKLEIELKGIDPAVLKSYSWFATTAAQHLGIEVGKWYNEIVGFNAIFCLIFVLSLRLVGLCEKLITIVWFC